MFQTNELYWYDDNPDYMFIFVDLYQLDRLKKGVLDIGLSPYVEAFDIVTGKQIGRAHV